MLPPPTKLSWTYLSGPGRIPFRTRAFSDRLVVQVHTDILLEGFTRTPELVFKRRPNISLFTVENLFTTTLVEDPPLIHLWCFPKAFVFLPFRDFGINQTCIFFAGGFIDYGVFGGTIPDSVMSFIRPLVLGAFPALPPWLAQNFC